MAFGAIAADGKLCQADTIAPAGSWLNLRYQVRGFSTGRERDRPLLKMLILFKALHHLRCWRAGIWPSTTHAVLSPFESNPGCVFSLGAATILSEALVISFGC